MSDAFDVEMPVQVRPLVMKLVMLDGVLEADGAPVDMLCFVSPSLLAMVSVDDNLTQNADTSLLDPSLAPVPVERLASILTP